MQPKQPLSCQTRPKTAVITFISAATAAPRCSRPTSCFPGTRKYIRRERPRCAVLPHDASLNVTDFSPIAAGGYGPEEELALVSFHIPVASPTTDTSDVVVCPDIRNLLVLRDSPLLLHDNFGGGFVDDEDRIALNTMRLSSLASSGKI